jgi:RNA polymerase sigma-70 factor (ECF subfamily)
MVDWDELVEREGPAVWRSAYRIVGNSADADECYQEAFLAALQYSTRHAVRRWPALLQRLAVARAIDRLRRRVLRTPGGETVDVASVASTARDPAEQAESDELVSAIQRAVAQLSVRQAELFCLHELEGWSYKDLAQHYELTVSAVGVQLHRARQELQQLLAAAIDERI